jgi:hypothetical protein
VVSVIGPRGRMGGRLLHELRFCSTMPDLLSYWQTRYGWTTAQLEQLDLSGTHSVSRKVRPATARRLHQLRCGWLPVNSREARIDPDRLPGCPACSPSNLVDETVDHIFQCSAPHRKASMRERVKSSPTLFASWKTSPQIVNALQTGVLAWLDATDVPSPASLNLHDDVVGLLTARAYDEQTSLGWNVLFRGFLSISWRHAQAAYFATLPGRKIHDNEEVWAGKAHLWFYELFESLWTLRCTDVHGFSLADQLSVRHDRCERSVLRLYHSAQSLPHCEQHPFRAPVADLLARPVSDQELWISLTETFLQGAFRRQRLRTETNQSTITDFFPRVPDAD